MPFSNWVRDARVCKLSGLMKLFAIHDSRRNLYRVCEFTQQAFACTQTHLSSASALEAVALDKTIMQSLCLCSHPSVLGDVGSSCTKGEKTRNPFNPSGQSLGFARAGPIGRKAAAVHGRWNLPPVYSLCLPKWHDGYSTCVIHFLYSRTDQNLPTTATKSIRN